MVRLPYPFNIRQPPKIIQDHCPGGPPSRSPLIGQISFLSLRCRLGKHNLAHHPDWASRPRFRHQNVSNNFPHRLYHWNPLVFPSASGGNALQREL